jgi:hypothetical protein
MFFHGLSVLTGRASSRAGAPCRGAVVLLACCGLVPGAVAGEISTANGVPHVENPAEAPGGVEKVVLEELWRVGGEADDAVFFGSISDITADAAGNVYILDQQLSQVNVLANDGSFLRTLSREGDGPGEIRRPAGLFFMPDGTLGVYQFFPGRVILLNLDGTPAGEFRPGGDATQGGFGGIRGMTSRNGEIYCSGGRMSPSDDGMKRVQYLARLAPDGSEEVRLLEKSSEVNFARREYIEKDDYFVDDTRWAVGPDGRVYAAPERDAYAIQVFAPDGGLERVIERRFSPRRRTAEEKEEVASGVVAVVNGQRVELDTQIEDYDPAISQIRVDAQGRLWVRHARSMRDQPDGVMETLDVFDPEGHLTRQVALACEGDARRDRLFFLGGNRVALVKGYLEARRSMFGAGGDSDQADDGGLLEVVCYRLPG